MGRIEQTFRQLHAQGKKALIPYVMAGDPAPQLTVDILHTLVEAGANLLELGVPFSDPMADGAAIQRASERALAAGVTLRQVLHMVAEFRTRDKVTPVILMGYLNPVERMGYAAFARSAQQAGVDGVLLVDYPPEEHQRHLFADHGLDNIFLLSPTTTAERMQLIAKQASGFVYYVSLKGVTGSHTLNPAEVAERIAQIRMICDLPVGVGFGIRDAETAVAIARFADAVVIGSRIVEEMESAPRDEVLTRIRDWVRDVRHALDHDINLEKEQA